MTLILFILAVDLALLFTGHFLRRQAEVTALSRDNGRARNPISASKDQF
jgi:hypothetical protein